MSKLLKNRIVFLSIAVLSMFCALFFIYFVNPDASLKIGILYLEPLYLLLLLIALSTFSFSVFLLKNIRRGVLIALFITVSLLLRGIGLKNVWYVAIFLVIVVLIEAIFFDYHPRKKVSENHKI